MIEIKAKVIDFVDDDGANIEIENHMEGKGEELMHESIAIIRALMLSLKQETPLLHLAIIRELAADPTILRGENQVNEHEEFAKMMSEMMSKSIIGKGEPS